jgi:hypothetical protein
MYIDPRHEKISGLQIQRAVERSLQQTMKLRSCLNLVLVELSTSSNRVRQFNKGVGQIDENSLFR